MYDLYPIYFKGYNSGWGRSDWFAETQIADWNDDNAQEESTFFIKNVPTTTSSSYPWNFEQVHTINTYLDKLAHSAMPDEPKRHWTGVNRFLRGLEYAKLVSNFGDVPYYQHPVAPTDKAALYRAFSTRQEVMDSVLSDMKYAMDNIRQQDEVKGVQIVNDLVYAYTSRIFLFEGTWQKYHNKNNELAAKYLQVAKDAADYIMKSKRYQLCSNYKDLTASIDLAGNPEIILYRAYVAGVVTHSLMSFNNTESEESSPSKSYERRTAHNANGRKRTLQRRQAAQRRDSQPRPTPLCHHRHSRTALALCCISVCRIGLFRQSLCQPQTHRPARRKK